MADKEDDGPGVFSQIGSAIFAFFAVSQTMKLHLASLTIDFSQFIFNLIYQFFVGLFICLETVWYPIKERISACCNICSKKNQRSQDPAFSTFDNE